MPYRIDIASPPDDALDHLVQFGVLDIELTQDGLAAILPDSVTPDLVARALGGASVRVSPAVSRDSGSVWLLRPRAVRVGRILIVPPEGAISSGAIRLMDSTAFGTGHHPTTALCVEAIEEALAIAVPESILDVGTGSGVLALAALTMGVPGAVGLDIDADALRVAEENARLNNLSRRLQLVPGGPEAASGVWPLVVANVLAAPLMEMAPVLVRRVGTRGRIILSGISSALESDVRQTYQRFGMRHFRSEIRNGWTVLVLQASW